MPFRVAFQAQATVQPYSSRVRETNEGVAAMREEA
jgi:hypothetical protein